MFGGLFSTIGSEIFSELIEACELVDVNAGTRLLHAGDDIDALYGVVHGALKLLRRTSDGLEQTIRELHRGEALGLAGMFVQRPVPIEPGPRATAGSFASPARASSRWRSSTPSSSPCSRGR